MRPYEAQVERIIGAPGYRLHVWRYVGDDVEMLMDDGTWQRYDAGVAPPLNAGLSLPQESLLAISNALRDSLGEKIPSEAEVRVLRQALDIERARVDRVLFS